MIREITYDIYTILWQDWISFKKSFLKFLLSRMITPILYIVAFGFGLGKNVNLGTVNYLEFIIPGMIALNSMNIAYNTVAHPLAISRIYYKTLENFLIAPINPRAIIIGKILTGVFRAILSSSIILLIAFVLDLKLIFGIGFFAVLLLNSAVFAAIGLVVGLRVMSSEELNNFSSYILMPMSFLCGTFFSTEVFPAYIKNLVGILPLTPAANLLRALAQGESYDYKFICILIIYLLITSVYAHKLLLKKSRE